MENKRAQHIVLFSGYAKLPTGITASEMYKVVGIIVTINIETGMIMEADCTLATALARKHVARLLVGTSMKNGPDKILHLIDQTYQGSAKKALITAIRIIYDKLRSYQEGSIPSLLD